MAAGPDRGFGPLIKLRRLMERIPSDPRCKLCAAPFAGLGGKVLPLAGFGRWEGNPSLCGKCRARRASA